jgi:tetratricopeptide (TPR) repeat protein
MMDDVQDTKGGADDEFAGRSHNDLYRWATSLVWPYLEIGGEPKSDPTTAEARDQLTLGVRLLNRVTRINPQNWAAHWALGMTYRAVREPEHEYEAFQRSYAINPKHADVAREFMGACLALGKGDEAIMLARRALELKPDDMGLLANLALALLIAGHVEEAHLTVQQARNAAPGDSITDGLSQAIKEIRAGMQPRPTKYP